MVDRLEYAGHARRATRRLSTINHQLSTAAVAGLIWFSALTGGGKAADTDSSLQDLDVEYTEAKVALQMAGDENDSLRAQLKLVQEQVKSLTESLAIANSESEVFKRETTDLKLRMEALGLDAASPDKAKLEQRLLKAVSDLKIVQGEKDKLADQLVRLAEVVVRFLKKASTNDGDARMALEIEMRSTSDALGMPSSNSPQKVAEAQAQPATLTDGMIISVKEEYALVVANLGREQGVKMGMPFQVWRGDERVGAVRVVDVRDKISGAVIQDLSGRKMKIQVGDRLKVDAQL